MKDISKRSHLTASWRVLNEDSDLTMRGDSVEIATQSQLAITISAQALTESASCDSSIV